MSNKRLKLVEKLKLRRNELSETLAEDVALTRKALKITVKFGWALLGVLLLCYVAYWITFIGPKSRLTNQDLQTQIATPIPSPIPNLMSTWTDDHVWLNPDEAMRLRKQLNVVNLALLSDGGARYSATSSLHFSPEDQWRPAVNVQISGLLVEGTRVQLTTEGEQYVLNMVQPFVLESKPSKVYVVDPKGNLFVRDLDPTTLTPIAQVQNMLQLELPANPNLSLTFVK